MAEIITSLFIVLSVVFLIVFLVFKSDSVTVIKKDYTDCIVKIKIYRKRRFFNGARDN